MQVLIDDNAGFCFGVVNAIRTAEEQLSTEGRLYCLGDIVHNSAEVHRLRQKGLQVIGYEQLEKVAHTPRPKVLIRAHGEPPSTYRRAESLGIEIIDATCPMVLGLQHRIRSGYEEMLAVGGQVVIFGKPGHAEVIGLNGQTENSAVIVSSPDDLSSIDFSRPIRLFSQTTNSKEDYERRFCGLQYHLRTCDEPYQGTGRVCPQRRCSAFCWRREQFQCPLSLRVLPLGATTLSFSFRYRTI